MARDGVLAAAGAASRVAPGVTRQVDDVLQGGVRGASETLQRSTTEAVTPEGMRAPIPQQRPQVDPNQRMVASVDSTGAASGIRFRDNYTTHVAQRDFNVPRRSGVGGAHNLSEFNRYLNEINVINRTPHPTMRGVETVEYKIPTLDRTGRPDGGWTSRTYRKTVYDPTIISDQQMMDWGRQAFAEAQAANRFVAPRQWVGTHPTASYSGALLMTRGQ